jgi:hypothetical protein
MLGSICMAGIARKRLATGSKEQFPENPWPDFSGIRKGNTLKFEVNGQQYFLAFVEQENKLYVFAPTPSGLNRMPVYVDAVKWKASIGAEATHLSS